MRFRLRTLMILLAILPPLLAWFLWPRMEAFITGQHDSTINAGDVVVVLPDDGRP